jgi:transposase InsO family protein
MRIVADLGDRFGVEPVLRVLDVAPSTFYGWLHRETEPADREHVDRGLLSAIVEVHEHSAATYGSPRMHATPARRGIQVGRKRVERLMRRHGLQEALLRRG